MPELDEELLVELVAHVTSHPRAGDPEAKLFYSREHGGRHSFDPDKPFDADNFAGRYLKPAVRRAGLPDAARSGVRFHDLRHTCAPLWFEAGIPLAVISRWLGHASVAVTDRVYVHLRPADDYSMWRERFRAAQADAAERRVVPLWPGGVSVSERRVWPLAPETPRARCDPLLPPADCAARNDIRALTGCLARLATSC